MKKLYRVLREEPALVDQFLLEIISTMLFSLRLASNDSNSLGTVAILEQVCEALAKIALHYKQKLVKKNDKRRMHKDLGRFMNWSLQQMSRVEGPVRRAAFSFILSMLSILSLSEN